MTAWGVEVCTGGKLEVTPVFASLRARLHDEALLPPAFSSCWHSLSNMYLL